MMSEVTAKLGISHESFTPYYPHANGQVEAINKVLKTMLQSMVGVHKSDWRLLLYAALWAYKTSIRTRIRFTPFQLVYSLEAILPIECEILSLNRDVELLPTTFIEEERILHMTHLDETKRDATIANERCIKSQCDKTIKPDVFTEGDLVLIYDKESDKLGSGKFQPM